MLCTCYWPKFQGNMCQVKNPSLWSRLCMLLTWTLTCLRAKILKFLKIKLLFKKCLILAWINSFGILFLNFEHLKTMRKNMKWIKDSNLLNCNCITKRFDFQEFQNLGSKMCQSPCWGHSQKCIECGGVFSWKIFVYTPTSGRNQRMNWIKKILEI